MLYARVGMLLARVQFRQRPCFTSLELNQLSDNKQISNRIHVSKAKINAFIL